MAENSPQITEIDDAQWRRLQQKLAEIALLAKSDAPLAKVAGELLESVVDLLAAEGGAVWLRALRDPDEWECQVRIGAPPDDDGAAAHEERMRRTAESREFQSYSTPRRDFNGEATESPAAALHLLHPVLIQREVIGLLEIRQRPSLNAAAIRGNRRLLAVVSELIADHQKLERLRRMGSMEARLGEFKRLVESVNAGLDLRTVAYKLANEGRSYIDCDRVSVAIRQGRSFRLAAISNVESLERRSNSVRRLEKLIAQVADFGEPLKYIEDEALEEEAQVDAGDEPPGAVSTALAGYLDQAHCRVLRVVPLREAAADGADDDDTNKNAAPRRDLVGALVVEQFTAEWDESREARTDDVAQVGAISLRSALQYLALPTLPFARRWRRRRAGGLVRWLLFAAAMLIGAALLAVIPMDFNVSAEGSLQPAIRRHVFAPLDGQIISILVNEGDQVEPGDVLIEMRSPELDLDVQRIQGEFDTTRQRLAAIESTLLQSGGGAWDATTQANQLAAEREELLHILESLERELDLLHAQRDELSIASPIRGRVLTWNLEQLLRDRPVQRGQALLSVGDVDGAWTAELEAPGDRIGYVLEAMQSAGRSPAVVFELATDRGRKIHGAVRQIATRTELDAKGKPTVRVSVSFEAETPTEFRPGATVYAQIDCGRKSIGYVYFHDLIEAVHVWFSF